MVSEKYPTSKLKISALRQRHDHYGIDSPSTARYLDFDEYDSLTEDDVDLISTHMNDRTIEEACNIISAALVEHDGDPCLSVRKLDNLRMLLTGPDHAKDRIMWTYAVRFEAFLILDWSIYPEIRAVTRPIDENGEDYETLRVYVLGVLWACAGSAMDTFFAERFPAITLNSGAILVLLVYSGKLWARLPRITIAMPFFRNHRFTVNSGHPWTFKEQMLATLTMSVSVGTPFAHKAVVAQSNNYFLGIDNAKNFSYIFMLVASSAFLGFGIAGIMRTFLVYPVRCVWFSVLPTLAVNRALVEPQPRPRIHGWRLKGYEWFGLCTGLSFFWYWVTNYLFQALSYFDWPAWIAPSNVTLQALSGCITGLALNPVSTFDWNNIGSGSITSPVFAKTMELVGMLLSMFALIGLWFSNTSSTGYFPINGTELYANDGKQYQIDKILNSRTYELDPAKYEAYSPPFWTSGSLVNLGTDLMSYTALIVYMSLNYSGFLAKTIRNFWDTLMHPSQRNIGHDRFSRAQRRYAEVPEWWFLIVLLGSVALSIAMIETFPFTETPVWTLFMGMGLSLLFSIPFGYLYATTMVKIEIGTLYELVLGYILPGNVQAMIVSKVYASNFFSQTLNYVTNQAQGHYTGIAPRALFRCQLLSVISATLVQSAIIWWQVHGGIPDMCNPHNREKYTCQHTRTYLNAAIQWGAMGPKRILDGTYPGLKWCFLAGAIYPIPFWLLRRYIPKITARFRTLLHYTHELALLGAISWAPQNLMYIVSAWYVNVAVNWYIKTRYPSWWATYAYLLVNALDVGVGFSGLVMFFTTEYKHQISIDWVGNTVMFNTGDAKGLPRMHPPLPRGYFGRDRGTFP